MRIKRRRKPITTRDRIQEIAETVVLIAHTVITVILSRRSR